MFFIWGISGACGAFLRHVWGIIWGMSVASAGAYLGHHFKACLGQSNISAVLHASLMPFLLDVICMTNLKLYVLKEFQKLILSSCPVLISLNSTIKPYNHITINLIWLNPGNSNHANKVDF